MGFPHPLRSNNKSLSPGVTAFTGPGRAPRCRRKKPSPARGAAEFTHLIRSPENPSPRGRGLRRLGAAKPRLGRSWVRGSKHAGSRVNSPSPQTPLPRGEGLCRRHRGGRLKSVNTVGPRGRVGRGCVPDRDRTTGSRRPGARRSNETTPSLPSPLKRGGYFSSEADVRIPSYQEGGRASIQVPFIAMLIGKRPCSIADPC
jgi:hypothetical protein